MPSLRHPWCYCSSALICWFALSTVWSLHPANHPGYSRRTSRSISSPFSPLVDPLLSARRRRMFACVLGGLGIVSLPSHVLIRQELLRCTHHFFTTSKDIASGRILVVFIPFAIASANRGKVAGFWMLALVIESFMVNRFGRARSVDLPLCSLRPLGPAGGIQPPTDHRRCSHRVRAGGTRDPAATNHCTAAGQALNTSPPNDRHLVRTIEHDAHVLYRATATQGLIYNDEFNRRARSERRPAPSRNPSARKAFISRQDSQEGSSA